MRTCWRLSRHCWSKWTSKYYRAISTSQPERHEPVNTYLNMLNRVAMATLDRLRGEPEPEPEDDPPDYNPETVKW